jgi:GNAT superfamily N-acetyltransferase
VLQSGPTAVLVATASDEVIGLATAHILSVINRAGDVAMLTAIVVDERVRSKGVGHALVLAVEAFARASGCERLTVTTYLNRKDAHTFYERIGFELTGRRYGKSLLP